MPDPRVPLLLIGALWSALAAPGAAQAVDGDDYYISVAAFGAVYRLDAESGALTPFATGLTVPFYGEWLDGALYLPNRGQGEVVRVDGDGSVSSLTGPSWQAPVTVAVGPDSMLYVSDIFLDTVSRVDPASGAIEAFVAAGGDGLLDGAGGLAFGPDGVLYVANFLSNTIAAVTPDGRISLATDGGGLIGGPGGVQVDGSGNLFTCNYNFGTITRTRLDTGETTVFAADPILVQPNDLKLTRGGALLATVKVAALVSVDVTGALEVLFQDTFYGEFDGVAVPDDFPRCTGRVIRYGAGTPGAGGLVPSLRGIFSPCPGATYGLEIEDAVGGALAGLFWGVAPAAIPFKGGELLVAFTPPSGQIPLALPGSGPGAGELVLPSTLPADPSLSGVSVFLQLLVADAAGLGGLALSNGVEVAIGL